MMRFIQAKTALGEIIHIFAQMEVEVQEKLYYTGKIPFLPADRKQTAWRQ
jgi:hypothetical protein